jgi:oligoribonuclease NrnB/cAMP/cGMP phosphodiesterase (DHH superfamily)
MRKICIYHAGCPDGFGAAWATRQGWGDDTVFIARGHDDALRADPFTGDLVLFADIAPPPDSYRPLADAVGELVVLDHHVSARDRFEAVPGLARELREAGHFVHFDLGHSGAMLAWRHFFPDEPAPPLLGYVEDQDLWNWKLPHSREVNAAIASRPRSFESWDALASRSVEDLAAEGRPIVRMQRQEVERALRSAHPVSIGSHRVEAVNSRFQRAEIGHELACRAAHGVPCGAVYRLTGSRVDISVYSVGDFDAGALAGLHGGGGHRNAAGFSVTLEDWMGDFA